MKRKSFTLKPDFRPWLPQETAGGNILRILMGCAGALCLFYGLIPCLGFGIIHSGVLLLLLFGGGFAGCVLFGGELSERLPRLYRWGRGLLMAAFGLALALYLLFIGSYRRYCAQEGPQPGEAATVIVLGGAIDGEEPKLMLSRRLRIAADYLQENPQASCIVSGGQGADEIVPEALAMQKYLIRLGIAPGRILQEDGSKNTRQNIAFSAKIIEEKGLPRQAVIATDSFHQLRAAWFCRQNGLTPSALPSLTPWGLLPSYELREMGAWAKALIETLLC